MNLSLRYARTAIKRLVFAPATALVFAVLLAGCSSTRPNSNGWGGRIKDSAAVTEKGADSAMEDESSHVEPGTNSADTQLSYAAAQIELLSILSTELHSWMGTPHVWGGTTLSGVDCSALIQSVYRDALNISLPRTTSELENIGVSVRQAELQTGDLVFFRPDGTGLHAGIYMANREFIHSSSSRGVMRSNVDEPYWDRYFYKARRVFTSSDRLIGAVEYARRMTKIRKAFQSN